MKKNWFLALAVLSLASPLFAETPASQPATVEKADAPDVASAGDAPKHLLTLNANFDIGTQYIYRGYKQFDGGVPMMPGITLNFNIPQLQDVYGVTITPYIGNWSAGGTVRNSPKSPSWFFENDTFMGAKFEKGNWTLDLYYQYNSYPGGAWTSTNEIDAVLAYDDSWFTKDKMHLPFAINPHVAFAQELNRSDNIAARPGSIGGAAPGSYLEFGIAPAMDVPILGKTVTFALPVTVGTSLNNYYANSNGGNQFLGYMSVGLQGTLPLDFLNNKGIGDWNLVNTFTYTRIEAATAIDANEGNRDNIGFVTSIQVTY